MIKRAKSNKRSNVANAPRLPSGRLPRELVPTTRLSFGQAIYPDISLDVPIQPFFGTTVAGALAASVSVDPSTILPDWGRFSALFREYIMQGASLRVQLSAGATTPQGFVALALQEKVPAGIDATLMSSPHLELPITAVNDDPAVYKLTWIAKDYADLQFVPTGTASTSLWIVYFASTAATGTNAATAATFRVSGSLALRFRGYLPS